MWYYLIVLIYAIMLIVFMVYTKDPVQELKYMAGIIYVVLSLLLCAVLDEIEEIKKRIKD